MIALSLRPAQAVTISEFALPTSNSDPEGITSGSDGNLWFTELQNGKIGRITTSGSISEYPVSSPLGITSGPDGNLWFTEFFNNKIGRITTSGTLVEYPLPVADSAPYGITSGPDGNLWFTECNRDAIARITTNGTVTEYYLTSINNEPQGITSGPDGNLWFTELQGNKIGRITTAGSITEYPIPTGNSKPACITSGSDGNLWFTEFAANQIGRITLTGTITEYPLATTNSEPMAITSGPDGNLWFAAHGWIERITTGGSVAAYPSDDSSEGITAGPDGNLWFTAGAKIGRLTPDAAHLSLTLNALSNSVVAGNNLTSTYTVTNTGPAPAQNVTLTTTLPANTTFVASGSSPGLTQTGSTLTANLGTLDANATVMVVVTERISASAPAGSSVSSSATITSSTQDNNLSDNSATGTTLVTAQADVAVTQTGVATANADNTISYNVSLTNNGPSDAQNVTLNDGMPTATTFVAATQTSGPAFTLTLPAVGSNGTLTGHITALSAGATATFTIVIQVNATTPDGAIINNTATVSSDTSDTIPGNNNATVATTIVNQADLAVTQTGPATANVRDNLSYSLSVTNNGPVTAWNVVLTNNLPASTGFVALTQNSGPAFTATTPAVGTNGTVTATLNALAPGATATFTTVAQVNASPPNGFNVSNTVTISSSTYDPAPANNNATVNTTINVPPPPTPTTTPTPVPTPTATPTPTPVPTPTTAPTPTPLPPTPAVSVQFNTVAAGEIYHSLPTLSGSVTESNAPTAAILTVQVSMQRRSDGKYWSGKSWSRSAILLPATLTHGVWTLPVSFLPHNSPNAQFLTDGQYTLIAIASDGTGYSAQAIVTISVDGTLPTLAITTPKDGAVLSVLTTISGIALDAAGGTGVRQVLLTLVRVSDGKYWNGSAFVTAPQGKGQAQPPTLTVSVDGSKGVWARRSGLPQSTNLLPGAYRISAVAIDGAGNRSQEVSHFTVAAPHSTPPLPTISLSNATASAVLSSIALKFTGALEADSASDPTHYSLVVNDHAVAVESAGYSASTRTVILGLPESSLRAGDRVVVKWHNLRDVRGTMVSGESGPLVAR